MFKSDLKVFPKWSRSSENMQNEVFHEKHKITDFYSEIRGGSRPVYKVCTNLSDFFPEKFFLECFCKVQMIPDFMGSEFALQ